MTLDAGRFDRTRFFDNGFLFQPANTAIRLPLESLPCASSSAFVVAHWSVPPLLCNLRLILSPDLPHFGSSSVPLCLTPAQLYLGSSSAQPQSPHFSTARLSRLISAQLASVASLRHSSPQSPHFSTARLSRLISAQLASVASLRHSSLHYSSAMAFTRLDRHEGLHTWYWHLLQ